MGFRKSGREKRGSSAALGEGKGGARQKGASRQERRRGQKVEFRGKKMSRSEC